MNTAAGTEKDNQIAKGGPRTKKVHYHYTIRKKRNLNLGEERRKWEE